MNIQPKIMGVLNVTPDSYYDGGQHNRPEAAVTYGLRLAQEGADIIDVGGESSRPFARPITQDEELARVIPVISQLAPQLPIPISIDTRRPAVAQLALASGASMINDITGCRDPKMRELVAQTGVPICVMHMQNIPATMQSNPHYPNGVIPTIYQWFEQQISELLAFGLQKSQLILDPGIGFGKTVKHNLDILRNLGSFKEFGLPVLVGASRKSFIQKILKKPVQNTLSATIAVHTIALAEQADILRVHDVAEHRDAVDLYSALYR